jgi:hypothetical protein
MVVTMASGSVSPFKRFLLWDYPRASWQYDVIVALILAFIFLTPRGIFRDQPSAGTIVRLPSEQGLSVFWVEPELLRGLPEPQRGPTVAQMLKSRYGKRESVVRLEPVFGSEQEIKGYMALTQP